MLHARIENPDVMASPIYYQKPLSPALTIDSIRITQSSPLSTAALGRHASFSSASSSIGTPYYGTNHVSPTSNSRLDYFFETRHQASAYFQLSPIQRQHCTLIPSLERKSSVEDSLIHKLNRNTLEYFSKPVSHGSPSNLSPTEIPMHHDVQSNYTTLPVIHTTKCTSNCCSNGASEGNLAAPSYFIQQPVSIVCNDYGKTNIPNIIHRPGSNSSDNSISDIRTSQRPSARPSISSISSDVSSNFKINERLTSAQSATPVPVKENISQAQLEEDRLNSDEILSLTKIAKEATAMVTLASSVPLESDTQHLNVGKSEKEGMPNYVRSRSLSVLSNAGVSLPSSQPQKPKTKRSKSLTVPCKTKISASPQKHKKHGQSRKSKLQQKKHSISSLCNSDDIELRRKYLCKVCGKGFTTSGHLARHNRIHTGEKRHVCPYEGCGQRFNRHDNCLQHYKTHLKRLKEYMV